MPLVAFSISIGLIAPSNNAPSTLSALLKHVPSKVTIHTRQIHPVLIFVLYHYPKLVLMKKAFEFCEDFASFVSNLRICHKNARKTHTVHQCIRDTISSWPRLTVHLGINRVL